ncbi:hypothetical protein NPIL_1751 [Nephila pilipes]|uniref:Uncharacterized protein n=1 Tax=Nephila pilipes TaxID=299642 RepID=A0A8X6UP39_NEPPI|nr:hypothetical protein NPIL_1751 [Nephila pilipes]
MYLPNWNPASANWRDICTSMSQVIPGHPIDSTRKENHSQCQSHVEEWMVGLYLISRLILSRAKRFDPLCNSPIR